MIETELFQLIAAGGDVGVWVLVAVFWKQDKRLTALEYGFKNLRDIWATFGPLYQKTTVCNGNKNK